MTDVLGDHGLTQAVGADQDKIARLGQEVQGQRPLDDVALDACRPRPVEIGHGLEPADLGGTQAAFEAAVRAFGYFDLRELFEQLARRPALLGGVGQHVIHLRGYGTQADPLQLFAQIMIRVLHRVGGRAHRRSPDRVGGLRGSGPADGGSDPAEAA